jgi:integrase
MEEIRKVGQQKTPRNKFRQRGTGCLIRRGETWHIQYRVDGQSVRVSSGSTDRGVALRMLKRKMAELETGTYVAPKLERVTVGELVNNLLLADKNDGGKKSLEWDERRWRLHLEPYFSRVKAKDVTKAFLNGYVSRRRDEEASNASINRELSIIRRAFREAEGIPVPKFPKKQTEANPRPGFVTDQQYDKLAVACAERGLWLRAMLEVGFRYGWRKGELLNLRVSNVDMLANPPVVRLDHADTKNNEPREIPLAGTALELIRQCIVGKKPTDHVFSRPDGSPVKDFRKSWAVATEAAGCPDLLFHDLRRSAVRNLANSGADRAIAMSITGHKTEAIFNRYRIKTVEDKAKVMERLYGASGTTEVQNAETARKPVQSEKQAIRHN